MTSPSHHAARDWRYTTLAEHVLKILEFMCCRLPVLCLADLRSKVVTMCSNMLQHLEATTGENFIMQDVCFRFKGAPFLKASCVRMARKCSKGGED